MIMVNSVDESEISNSIFSGFDDKEIVYILVRTSAILDAISEKEGLFCGSTSKQLICERIIEILIRPN